MVYELRTDFTFLNGWEKKKSEEYFLTYKVLLEAAIGILLPVF